MDLTAAGKRRINMLSDLGFREMLIQRLHAYIVLLDLLAINLKCFGKIEKFNFIC